MSDNEQLQAEQEESPIEFVLGTGNHSVICGATTPVVTLDLDERLESSDEPTP